MSTVTPAAYDPEIKHMDLSRIGNKARKVVVATLSSIQNIASRAINSFASDWERAKDPFAFGMICGSILSLFFPKTLIIIAIALAIFFNPFADFVSSIGRDRDVFKTDSYA